MSSRSTTLEIAGKKVPVSNLDKVLYPATGFTKGEVIDYYIRISPFLLPHLHGRPLSLKRYPNGVDKQFFYEKRCPPYRPKWVKTVGMWSKVNQETIHFCEVDDLPSLVWAANLANLELHTYLCERPKIAQPTSLVFDLDPGEGVNVLQCAELALLLRTFFDKLKLKSFVKTSGSKGLQVYVPINTAVTFDKTKEFARALAQRLSQQFPQKVTADMDKHGRRGKVLIDWSQNDAHKTTVCVYSLRGKESPTVSTPVTWEELKAVLKSKSMKELVFGPDEVLKRVKKTGDLFKPLLTLKQKLPPPSAFAHFDSKKSHGLLKTYQQKRDFEQTSEPSGEEGPIQEGNLFVIQKHAASHLHYDFRLEADGVLKSWAVPKGLPVRKGEKRLAVQVEDHPLNYARFEGTIPKGNYGGGTVMVWDIGIYSVTDSDIGAALKAGTIHLHLAGKKLKGDWTLVRLKRSAEAKQPWLILKSGSDHKPISKKHEDQSALTGRSMSKIAIAKDAEWDSKGGKERRAVNFKADLQNLPKATPSFVEPMKARLAEKLPKGDDWQFEIKFDGVRTIAIKNTSIVKLISRTRHSLNNSFQEIAVAVSELSAKSFVLDGEIVALDKKGRSSFQLLQPFIHGERSSSTRPPIVFYVFDLLNLEGKSTASLPLEERKTLLEKLLRDRPELIRLSSAIDELPKHLLKRIQKLGLEGLIGKRRGSHYEAGRRSGSWIKIKIVAEQEFVIGGYTQPRGSREFFGSLLIGYYEQKRFLYASKVGTGFDSRLLGSLFKQFQKMRTYRCPFDNLPSPPSDIHGVSASEMKHCTWLKPKLVAQIRFSQWTKDNHLRQPVFLGLHDDKPPRQVIREIAA